MTVPKRRFLEITTPPSCSRRFPLPRRLPRASLSCSRRTSRAETPGDSRPGRATCASVPQGRLAPRQSPARRPRPAPTPRSSRPRREWCRVGDWVQLVVETRVGVRLAEGSRRRGPGLEHVVVAVAVAGLVEVPRTPLSPTLRARALPRPGALPFPYRLRLPAPEGAASGRRPRSSRRTRARAPSSTAARRPEGLVSRARSGPRCGTRRS